MPGESCASLIEPWGDVVRFEDEVAAGPDSKAVKACSGRLTAVPAAV